MMMAWCCQYHRGARHHTCVRTLLTRAKLTSKTARMFYSPTIQNLIGATRVQSRVWRFA